MEAPWSRKHLCVLLGAQEGPARFTGHAGEVRGCSWTLWESARDFFSTRVVGIASFPAAGSAFTPVTKTTSASARYRGTIQGKMGPNAKGFDFFPQNQVGTASYLSSSLSTYKLIL